MVGKESYFRVVSILAFGNLAVPLHCYWCFYMSSHIILVHHNCSSKAARHKSSQIIFKSSHKQLWNDPPSIGSFKQSDALGLLPLVFCDKTHFLHNTLCQYCLWSPQLLMFLVQIIYYQYYCKDIEPFFISVYEGWRRRLEDGAGFWNLRKTIELPKLIRASLSKVSGWNYSKVLSLLQLCK